MGLEVSQTLASRCLRGSREEGDEKATLLTSLHPVPRILPRQVTALSPQSLPAREEGGTYME